jgi:tetratricopeptide (TPR) repeat protein
MYLGQENTQFQKLLLLGAKDESFFTAEIIEQRLQAVPFAVELPGQKDIFSFLSYFIADGRILAPHREQVRLNTFDRPVIEYSSPRNKWTAAKTIKNLQYLAGLRNPAHTVFNMDSDRTQQIEKFFETRTYILEGECQELIRQYEKAGYYYTRAAMMEADTLLVSRLLTRLAVILESQNKPGEAENTLRNALAVDKRNAEAAFALAENLNKAGRSDAAIPFYKYTVELDTTHHVAYRKLGDLFAQKQEFENAFYVYSRSVSIEPAQPVVYYILGQLYFNYKKDASRAEWCFQKSLEIDPNHRYREQAIQMLRKIREHG